MLSNVHVGRWPADMKCCTKNVFFLSKKADGHTTFCQLAKQVAFFTCSVLPPQNSPQGTIKIINILYQRKG